jgi:hypothetical protein
MGNNNSTQIAQLNLSQNLLPQSILNEYNQLIISDIFSNIGDGVASLPGNTISQTQLVTYIKQLDLYSQVVNSISTITAQNMQSDIIDNIVINAMTDKTTLELLDFNTQVNSISPNINGDIFVVNNKNLINLFSNIVKDNLDVTSVKNCFLVHTSTLTNIQSNNAQQIIVNAINNCTAMINQLSIITSNICDNLDIKITATNTIKTPKEYLAQFQAQLKVLQNQYNAYNAEITGPQFAYYNDDKQQLYKLHEITKKMVKIQSEIEQLVNKIDILEEQPNFSPEVLAMIEGKIQPKNMLDISGNKVLKYNFKNVQKHIQIDDENQTTKQLDNLQNNLKNDQNIDLSSNLDLKLNKNIYKKPKETDKESGFFGGVPKVVRTIIFICCSMILLISSLVALFVVWRVRSTISMVSKVKDLSSDKPPPN